MILPVRPRRRLAGFAAATVALALLGGATAAWLGRGAPTPQPENRPTPSAAPEQPLVTEQRKHEQFLLEAVEKYANPAGDPSRRELGLRHSVELALFYLKDNRLEEADEFFDKLIKNPANVRPYRLLGRLGHAIVLAHEDRVAESNQLFLELMGKGGLEQARFLLNQPQLRYEVARALEHNRANLRDQPLPAELERFREPPRAPPAVGKQP
jgi:hypothetical protein